jgi:hypothetical protein
MDYIPILKTREIIAIHLASLEKKESVKIEIAVPRQISDQCPWIQAYK